MESQRHLSTSSQGSPGSQGLLSTKKRHFYKKSIHSSNKGEPHIVPKTKYQSHRNIKSQRKTNQQGKSQRKTTQQINASESQQPYPFPVDYGTCMRPPIILNVRYLGQIQPSADSSANAVAPLPLMSLNPFEDNSGPDPLKLTLLKDKVEPPQVIPPYPSPSEGNKIVSLIRKNWDEQCSSFENFLTYSSDDVNFIPINSVAFHTNSNESGQTIKLLFNLLGHTLPLCDFASFSFVTHVTFAGHFSYITTAYKIISQLLSLKEVKFEITKTQRPFFLEKFEEDLTIIPPNPSVKSLKVNVNSDSECGEFSLLDRMIYLLFSRIEVCLPSLKKLNFQLPLIPVSKKIFLRLLQNSSINDYAPQFLTYSIQCSKENPTLTCDYETLCPHSLHVHILNSWSTSVFDTHRNQCYNDFFNNHRAKQFIENVFDSPNSTCTFTRPSQTMYSKTSPPPPWEPSDLSVQCGFTRHENCISKSAFIQCSPNGREFDGEVDYLHEFEKAVVRTRMYHSQISSPVAINYAKKLKVSKQRRLVALATLKNLLQCTNSSGHSVTPFA